LSSQGNKSNSSNNKNNKRRKHNNNNWTAYKHYPRSVCVTVYDMQGSPISDDIVKRIVSQVEESIKGSSSKNLAIAVNKG
jgi:hypothetical protein